MKIFFAILIISFSFVLLDSCNQKVDSCTDDIICTQEFASVAMQVTDTLNKPYILDSFKVINAVTSTVIIDVKPNKLVDTTGYYTIFSDTYMDKVEKDGTVFNFHGWGGANLKVNEEFKIGHNCCHIVQKNGKAKIVVQP